MKQKKISDWPPAKVVYRCRMRPPGWSIRRLSAELGYSPVSLKGALHKPWPKAEEGIAEYLGLPPWAIWPSRYDENGKPRGRSGRKTKRSVVREGSK